MLERSFSVSVIPEFLRYEEKSPLWIIPEMAAGLPMACFTCWATSSWLFTVSRV